MNNKHHAVIVVLLLIIVFLAGALAFVLVRQAVSRMANAPATATTTPVASVSAQNLNETGQYYTVTAAYPGSTLFAQSAGPAADAAAVASMKSFVEGAIAQFKKDGNFANLTATDITTQGLDQGNQYSLNVTYQTYQGPHTVSYVFTVVEDTLGAHPNTTYKTFTFDRTSGATLGLGDLFTSKNYLTQLSAVAQADLPNIVAAQQQAPADIGAIKQGTAASAAYFATWYLDGTSLVLLFPPYQIGPYSLGTVKDSIALSRLTTLKPQYR